MEGEPRLERTPMWRQHLGKILLIGSVLTGAVIDGYVHEVKKSYANITGFVDRISDTDVVPGEPVSAGSGDRVHDDTPVPVSIAVTEQVVIAEDNIVK